MRNTAETSARLPSSQMSLPMLGDAGDYFLPIKQTVATRPVESRKTSPEKASEFIKNQMFLPIIDGANYVVGLIDQHVVARSGKGRKKTPWKVNDIVKLHDTLLEDALSILAKSSETKAVKKEQLDALSWFFSDFVELEQDGKVVKVRAEEVPFSFLFCCRLNAMNPETFRDFIFSKVDKRMQEILHQAKAA